VGDPAESASLRLLVLEHRLAVCRGPLEFGLTGVLASLDVPLAESKVGILGHRKIAAGSRSADVARVGPRGP